MPGVGAVLLGDAAWGVTLGGMGVGTGLVGAYVLASELAVAGGDPRVALPAYERRMRGYASRWQRGANPGRFLAPAGQFEAVTVPLTSGAPRRSRTGGTHGSRRW